MSDSPPVASMTMGLFCHANDPKRPKFANGSRSEVPLGAGFPRQLSIAAERTLRAYGLWAPGDPATRGSPAHRVRRIIAKIVRRHAVYANRPVPDESRVVLTLGVGPSTDALVIEMRPRPASMHVQTFGVFAVPRKGKEKTAVYEREYTCAQIAADETYPCDPIHIARVLTELAYPNHSTPRTHSQLIEMLPPPPDDDLCGKV